MNNEELKKKIVEIIINAIWKDAEADYDSTDETEAGSIADALIAAGIGDVSELKKHRVIVGKSLIPEDDNAYVLPNIPLTVKQLYSGEEVEKMAQERKELKDELRSKVEYIREQDEVIKEYKHRAESAEHELERRLAEATKAMYVYDRALYYATLNGETADEVKYNDALKRAQKDFAENKGD